MLESLAVGELVSLAARQPGVIVGPIARFLGTIYNGVFNFIYNLTGAHALGIAIIVFTILVKTVLLPLVYKQQKSTFAMQKLQPEMDKIKKKYEKKKDAESQQRMALELQSLQKDNNVSMFGGCLPLLVQLPILYALFHIFQQAYMYIDVVSLNYGDIADVFLTMPEVFRVDLLRDFIISHKLNPLDVAVKADLLTLINQLDAADWGALLANAGDYTSQLTDLLIQKNELENFLGINMIQNAGWKSVSVAIPLLAGASTYLSSRVMMKENKQSDEGAMGQAMQTMKMMNYMMPIMMGVMCVTLPAAVGLYWTISNLIQVGQSLAFSKYFKSKRDKEALQ